ncbi:hypothetical protein GCM10010413_41460 [Promicromonospora sukumoe]|uniref:Uncharacterized protein n=1 Tax=Promicromonospora sukumoe TaxID=88382 RepID=A0A7W3JE19_9MICO|nr:hypothetical protein [Promicromonospora sukumoe]MBA8811147.1 hypothetical protein [Promicromonospora sukumoe]
MNQHDGRDQNHGWVDPEGTDLLAQTLGAMAGGVDPASPTGPAAATSAMGRRVRRRRGAKLGGLGGGALALAAAVALGAGQLAPPDQAEVLPGSPAPAPAFQVQDGYQPPWLEWSDLTCGMPVDDLTSTAQGWSVAPAGDIYARTTDLGGGPSTSWGMAATVEEGDGSLDVAPVLVWSQDGVVVDLGPDVFDAPGAQSGPLLGGSDGDVAAAGGPASTCVPAEPGSRDTFGTPLPDGDYEVRAVAFPEAGPGERATAVSEPVPVRLDADGAHGPGAARDDEPLFGFPVPVQGHVSLLTLDRTTDLVTAEMTQLEPLSDVPMAVFAQCVGGDPEVGPQIELVLPSTGEVVGGMGVSCDGEEAGTEVGVLPGAEGGEVVDIRLKDVPDGVSRLWVSLDSAGPPLSRSGGPECSATGFEPKFDLDGFPTGDVATAAANIVLAAMDCDSEALIALAEDSGTELMPGSGTPEQVFALPEPGTDHYLMIAALLSDTRGEIVGDVAGDVTGDETVVWPRVATEEFRDSEEAWDEVVAAGLLTAEEAEAQRAHGYQGPRIAIGTDMTWQSYTAGE